MPIIGKLKKTENRIVFAQHWGIWERMGVDCWRVEGFFLGDGKKTPKYVKAYFFVLDILLFISFAKEQSLILEKTILSISMGTFIF